MALSLKKYEPLPNIMVQGNNFQAPNLGIAPVAAPSANISLPAPANPNLPTSWSTPPPMGGNRLLNFAQQNFINPVNNSIGANLLRIGSADITNNPVARANASARLKGSYQALNQNLDNPLFVAASFAEGGSKLPKPAVTLTNQELKAGRALGMKKQAILAAKTENAMPKVISTAASKMTPEDLAALKPSEQMAVDQLRGAGPPSKAPAEVNLKMNPYTPNIREVAPGDYGGARIAGQQLSQPIKAIASRFEQSMNILKKTSPDEWKNFWKLVEKPPADASPEFQQAAGWWREGANRVHGSATALGTNTNYLKDFALHPWKLDKVTEEQIASGGPGVLGSHAINRKYRNISEGEAAGLQLGQNPTEEGMKYLRGGSNAVERLASKRALAQADALQANKPHTLDLGYGHSVQLSPEGMKAARALEFHSPSSNKALVAARTTNAALKTSILSGGQFHPFNIAVMRAGPAIAVKGHPVAAVRGVARTFRPLLPGGKGFVNKVLTRAHTDQVVDPGTGRKLSYIDAAATIGAPYGEAGYNVAGTKLKSGVGHKLVFERQMPMMHDQVIRSVVNDLVEKGIPLASEEARQAGLVANSTMGFINKEAVNISPRARQAMSDFMLAGQFTPSKVVTLSKVGKGGVAGQYARADVAANVAGALLVATGVGYLVKQNSDSARDLLLRALINPSVPTPYKDKKGNNQELRLPLTYTGEISKILGITLKRGTDGHLHPNFNAPQNMPGTLTEWLRSRLSPGASSAVKLATNKNFADKPMYDPNAPAGTKAAQAGTTLAQGFLPIGTQGLAYTDAVKKHLPNSAQDVLNAGTPGSNPLLKSALSSVGFTPRTDQTVGKAQQSAQYFDAVAQAGKGLDRQSKDAYDLWTGSKKNPVTGKYDVQPNANDSRVKATVLLQNPKALTAIISLNQGLAKQGQTTDPLWGMSKDQITKYLQYQAMPPGSADKTDWFNKNQSWYSPLVDQRNQFFDSLPPGDPNKPKLDIQYPNASPAVSSLQNQYSALTDSAQKGQFLDQHPELIQQWNKVADYTNQMRQALGYSPLKNYPEATPQLQSFMNSYSSASKSQRAQMRSASPQQYRNMIGYFDSVDLYNIGKEASVSQLQGNPDYTSKEAKAISSLAKDIYQNPQGTYSVVPAGWMQGLSNSSGGSSSGKSSSKKHYVTAKSLRGINPSTGYDKIRKGKVGVKGKGTRSKVVARGAKGSPKVTLKKSLV